MSVTWLLSPVHWSGCSPSGLSNSSVLQLELLALSWNQRASNIWPQAFSHTVNPGASWGWEGRAVNNRQM